MQHLNVTATQGLIAAVVNFAFLMVLYLRNMNLLAEWWVGILALLIIVVFMFSGTSAVRSAIRLANSPTVMLSGITTSRTCLT